MRVSERELRRMAVGDKVTAHYPSLDLSVDGVVARIGLEVDPRTRTLEVLAHIPNADGRIRSGLFTELKIQPTARRKALIVPGTAVGGNGDQRVVYVIKDGVVHRTPVVVLPNDELHMEIAEGLAAGQVIVAQHIDRVSDGRSVTTTKKSDAAPVDAPPATPKEEPAAPPAAAQEGGKP